MASALCIGAVGLVFLVAGLVKALDCHPFIRQLAEYRILTHPWRLRQCALAFIAIEFFFGAALLVQLAPWIIPVSIALLVVLASATAWAAATKRVANCGCYGGLVLLTPLQSIVLDLVYIGLLLAGSSLGRDEFASAPAMPPVWKIAVVVAFAAGGFLLGKRSLWKPIYEFVLLKPGKSWRRDWLPDHPEIATAAGPFFLVFMTAECPYCKQWVPLMNIIEVQPDLPKVMSVMSLEPEEKAEFQKQHVIHFPIAHMHQSAASMMVKAYPTAVWIENGRIKEKWVGEMPQLLLDRLRTFYEAIAPPKETKAFGG